MSLSSTQRSPATIRSLLEKVNTWELGETGIHLDGELPVDGKHLTFAELALVHPDLPEKVRRQAEYAKLSYAWKCAGDYLYMQLAHLENPFPVEHGDRLFWLWEIHAITRTPCSKFVDIDALCYHVNNQLPRQAKVVSPFVYGSCTYTLHVSRAYLDATVPNWETRWQLGCDMGLPGRDLTLFVQQEERAAPALCLPPIVLCDSP